MTVQRLVFVGRPPAGSEKNRLSPIGVRVPKAMHDHLVALAQERGQSLTDVVNDALEKYLRAKGNQLAVTDHK